MTISSLTMVLILSAATPPTQEGVATVLGPKAYRDGDVIEITDVTATSSRLEHGDSVTVRGRVHLKSREKAQMCLYLTATEGDGIGEVNPSQRTMVSKGQSEFELKTTIRNLGVLHLTFYDIETGDEIGGTYFGTAEQMNDIADWDVSYYLSDDDLSDDDSLDLRSFHLRHFDPSRSPRREARDFFRERLNKSDN